MVCPPLAISGLEVSGPHLAIPRTVSRLWETPLLPSLLTIIPLPPDTRWRAATEGPRQAREGLGARWGSLINYGNRLGPCYRRPSYPEEVRSLIIRKIDHSPSPGDDRLADWGGICFLSYSNDPRRRPQGCAQPRLGLRLYIMHGSDS